MAFERGTELGVLKSFLAAALVAFLPTCTVSEPLDQILSEANVSAQRGCFVMDFAYVLSLHGMGTKAASMERCQELCQAQTSCTFFSYWNTTGECRFADVTAEKVHTAAGVVSGWGLCPSNATLKDPICVSAVPQNGFPGFTANASHQAWKGGRQPRSLECWPQRFNGFYQDCGTTVIEDTAKGWPGTCTGMMKRMPLSDHEAFSAADMCREFCRQDPACPAWIIGADGDCYYGMGHDCYYSQEFTPSSGERLQHGQIRKLMDLSGWHIMGLTQVFSGMDRYFQTDAKAAEACKLHCYSDIQCQFWQYAPGYGCWVEDVSKEYKPGYPLTLDYASRETPFALACKAGEFIQHHCDPAALSKQNAALCSETGSTFKLGEDGGWSQAMYNSSSGACQAACAITPECGYFTYFPNGKCELFPQTAVRFKSYGDEISGPKVCNMSSDAKSESGKNEGTTGVGECVVDSRVYHYALLNLTILNLDYDRLNLQEGVDLAKLYRVELVSKMKAAQGATLKFPDGGPAAVDLSRGPGGTSTVVTTWVLNRPPISCDWAWLQKALQDPDLAERMRGDTLVRLGLGALAVNGHLEVVPGQLSQTSVKQPYDPPLKWVPYVLMLLVMLLCAYFYVSGKAKRCTRRLRFLAPDADYTDSDDADGDGSPGSPGGDGEDDGDSKVREDTALKTNSPPSARALRGEFNA